MSGGVQVGPGLDGFGEPVGALEISDKLDLEAKAAREGVKPAPDEVAAALGGVEAAHGERVGLADEAAKSGTEDSDEDAPEAPDGGADVDPDSDSDADSTAGSDLDFDSGVYASSEGSTNEEVVPADANAVEGGKKLGLLATVLGGIKKLNDAVMGFAKSAGKKFGLWLKKRFGIGKASQLDSVTTELLPWDDILKISEPGAQLAAAARFAVENQMFLGAESCWHWISALTNELGYSVDKIPMVYNHEKYQKGRNLTEGEEAYAPKADLSLVGVGSHLIVHNGNGVDKWLPPSVDAGKPKGDHSVLVIGKNGDGTFQVISFSAKKAPRIHTLDPKKQPIMRIRSFPSAPATVPNLS